MWLLIVMLHVNAGNVLTLREFESEKDCLDVLKIIQDHSGSGMMGNFVYGECKGITKQYR